MVLPITLLLVSLSSLAGGSDMDYYLGSEYKGNYVWGLAMNLAWNELNESILHEKVKLKTNNKSALRMADQLNDAPFTKNDLDEKSYYIKSGYGQKTVDLINKESRAKFPEKSFNDLQLKFRSYGYHCLCLFFETGRISYSIQGKGCLI
jgi:hypothetical protein